MNGLLARDFTYWVEGMVSSLTTYRVNESYGFALFFFSLFFLSSPFNLSFSNCCFATCLDSLNLNDIPLFLLFLLTGVCLSISFFFVVSKSSLPCSLLFRLFIAHCFGDAKGSRPSCGNNPDLLAFFFFVLILA